MSCHIYASEGFKHLLEWIKSNVCFSYLQTWILYSLGFTYIELFYGILIIERSSRTNRLSLILTLSMIYSTISLKMMNNYVVRVKTYCKLFDVTSNMNCYFRIDKASIYLMMSPLHCLFEQSCQIFIFQATLQKLL